MRLYGLIGWPLGHSFSNKYFSEKFEREGIDDARYELFPLEKIANLPAILAQNPEIAGLNVTIPYKESVIPLLHELDETAAAIGAINCIKVVENQQLKGYNSDAVGFEKSLVRWLAETDVRGLKGLILGTGGASKAVAFVLKKLEIPFKFVSRNPQGENQIRYEGIENPWRPSLNPSPSTILINATPLGTFPNIDQMPPVPLNFFTSGIFVYDLIYNPAETLLLREAKARGCTVKNGFEMLELQAEAAWEIWQGNR